MIIINFIVGPLSDIVGKSLEKAVKKLQCPVVVTYNKGEVQEHVGGISLNVNWIDFADLINCKSTKFIPRGKLNQVILDFQKYPETLDVIEKVPFPLVVLVKSRRELSAFSYIDNKNITVGLIQQVTLDDLYAEIKKDVADSENTVLKCLEVKFDNGDVFKLKALMKVT